MTSFKPPAFFLRTLLTAASVTKESSVSKITIKCNRSTNFFSTSVFVWNFENLIAWNSYLWVIRPVFMDLFKLFWTSREKTKLWAFFGNLSLYFDSCIGFQSDLALVDFNLNIGTPDHLLLDSAPNLGPLISRSEINKFENCSCTSVRILEVLNAFVSAIFEFVEFPTRYEWSNIRRPVQNNRCSGYFFEFEWS
jgi:hypothetical protein